MRRRSLQKIWNCSRSILNKVAGSEGKDRNAEPGRKCASRAILFLLDGAGDLRWNRRMFADLEKKRDDVTSLCQKFGVLRLDVFGSATTTSFQPDSSDLDFIAQFSDTQAPDYADRYLDFAGALESLFDRHVDLLTEASIRNPYFKGNIAKTRMRFYGS